MRRQLVTLALPLLLPIATSMVFVSCSSSPKGNAAETTQAPAPIVAAHEQPAASEHDHHDKHEAGMHGNHRFEKADEWVSRFEGPERDAWQKPELVVESMSIARGMVVADIGAGTGYFLPQLAKAVGEKGKAIGVDIEADMVRYMSERIAREKLVGASAQACTEDDPGLAAGSVDRILIVDTWHHIAGREAYSAKLAAALRPAGQVYIVDFTLESPHGPPKEHRLSAETVIAELAAGGLQAEQIAVDLPYQWVVRASSAP